MRKLSHPPILALLLVLAFSCARTEKHEVAPTKADKAYQSIAKWMENNSDEYPGYESVDFGEFTARYERTERTLQLYELIEKERAKELAGNAKLDSLKQLLEQNKGLLLGYTLLHRYRTKSLAGETIEKESLFFLDTMLRVATILNPESFDMILDERAIFVPDTIFE